MQRRAFLKGSAAGVGGIAGLYGGASKALGQAARQPAWGVNAVALKSPWPRPPSLDELLADREHTLSLDRFHRVGGDNRAATPTECRIAQDRDALLVVFRCAESDMAFPYANLDPELWSKTNWHSLGGLPSGAASSWPPYPDEVDILIQPDPDAPVFYQFAATPQGKAFGCRRARSRDADASADEAGPHDFVRVSKVAAFEARIVGKAGEWLVLFEIPWKTLGGKPKSCFGLLPMRTRWRDGEFSSPVALDFNESMPVDLLIETHFSGAIPDAQSSLVRLPSGILRWQAPAAPAWPDAETCRRIWRLQSSLATPTDANNLAGRLALTQAWMDLMLLEGFTPLRTGWGLLPNDLTLTFLRQKMNAAFRKKDVAQACKLLDSYLGQLDEMSRWWFADGSPANIRGDAWTAITGADLEVQGDALLMRCAAGNHRVELRLAVPITGGARLYCEDGGAWRPAGLAPLNASLAAGACTIKTANGAIVVQQQPFSISFRDASREVMKIEGRDLAFRFGPDGKILATDFKRPLDPGEVIYGFGEQYDRFDHHGSVRTLWGTDDTIGNGKGLANATYKPLPIFHSSRPCMVFSNSSYRLRADVGKTNPNQLRLTQHGPVFDYYFWLEAPARALESYTALTGRPPVPPRWAFEPWMGRGGEAWADGNLKDSVAWINGQLSEAVGEEESAVARFAGLDIPHSAIYAEGPSALSTELNQFMAPRGIKTLGYFRPEIGPARQQALMPELKASDLPILHCDTEAQTAALEYVDFTNPNAKELCRRVLKRAFDQGVAGSMVDFGDWVPDSAVFHDGRRGPEMHNIYAHDYHRTVSEVFRERRGDDFILYARAAAPGTQKWLGQFAGDHPSNFDGLRHVLTGALNLCACGFSTWGSDIGGYFGFPQPAVYMRWLQFGCFSPLMRTHGIAPREPWHYGEAAIANYRFFAWVRENLLDYIHDAARAAQETGLPIMRAMPLAFPGAPLLAAVPDQYMFGPDLLVAPVVNEEVSRTIAFPAGTWTSLWDGKTVTGPVTRKVSAPSDIIPVYLRAGAALPVQLNQELQFGGSMTARRVHALLVTPDTNAAMAWTLEAPPETLLVYGVAAASAVRVNGEALSGWEADPARNRLVIRLPPRRTAAMKIELRL